MTIGIIVATDPCRVIGINNTIPWKSKADMKRFKNVTMGSSLIMGRTTWESIGRPLPGRKIFVITHRPMEVQDGVLACGSVEEAFDRTKDDPTVWVAGGESIYKQAMPFVSLVDHTIIPETVALPLDPAVSVARFPDLPTDFIPRDETKNADDPNLTIKTYVRSPSLSRMKANSERPQQP